MRHRQAQDGTPRVNCYDSSPSIEQLPGRDARSRADIEHAEPVDVAERFVDAMGVRRTCTVVLVGYGLEGHHGRKSDLSDLPTRSDQAHRTFKPNRLLTTQNGTYLEMLDLVVRGYVGNADAVA